MPKAPDNEMRLVRLLMRETDTPQGNDLHDRLLAMSAGDPEIYMETIAAFLKAAAGVSQKVHRQKGIPKPEDRVAFRRLVGMNAQLMAVLASVMLNDVVQLHVNVRFGADGTIPQQLMDEVAKGIEEAPAVYLDGTVDGGPIGTPGITAPADDDDEDFVLKDTLPTR